MRNNRMIAAICIFGLSTIGCHSPAPPKPAVPGTRSTEAVDHAVATAPADRNWENASKGIRVCYPAGWQPRKDPDFELMLIPAGAARDDPRITIDIPDLPPHMPWMIQMSRIERDYLADLKKSHPDLKVEDAADANVANSTARLVRSTWHQDKIVHQDVVLLMIHANAVYILDAQSDAPHDQSTRTAFDSIEASIHWSK